MSGERPAQTLANNAILDWPRSENPASVAPVRRALWLNRLVVEHFRSYAAAEITTDRRPVVLTGPNGAGKTNLLEAISLLVPGRGLRQAKLGELDRRRPNVAEADPAALWTIAATVMTPEGPRELGTGRDPTLEPGSTARRRDRRLVKIDHRFVRRQLELGEILAMVWLTPQMDGLFRDGATARRRFLDRLVCGFDTAHVGRINGYEQTLRERARLLKAGRSDDAWISALEDGMARHGVAIAAARRELIARLNQACALGVGRFPRAGLMLAGEVESWLDRTPALDAEALFRTRLVESRRQDAEAGGAAVGPHRSDMRVRHLGRDAPAEICSTGEQKALLVSIVLAHARLLDMHRGVVPLLLLDEIAAHLDVALRGALFDEILALGAQAWLTGTDAAVFADLGDAAQFFQLREARISPAAPAGRA